MKVICTSTCQKGRKTVYQAGKKYDIPEEMFKKNKAFFKKAENKAEK